MPRVVSWVWDFYLSYSCKQLLCTLHSLVMEEMILSHTSSTLSVSPAIVANAFVSHAWFLSSFGSLGL